MDRKVLTHEMLEKMLMEDPRLKYSPIITGSSEEKTMEESRKPPTRLERNLAKLVVGAFSVVLIALVPASILYLKNNFYRESISGPEQFIVFLSIVYLFLCSLPLSWLLGSAIFRLVGWTKFCLTTPPREEWPDMTDHIDAQ